MAVITDPSVALKINEPKWTGKYLKYPSSPAGCSLEDTWEVRTYGYRYNQHYSDEQRVLPENPLLEPTSRPTIYRQVEYYGLNYARNGTVCSNVNYGRWYIRSASQARLTDVTNNISAPLTNWETRARLKLKDRSVNLAENLFEFRQTAGMFYDAGMLVRDAWYVWKKKKRWRKLLRPCDVAASELVYSFGINPIIYTLHDSYWALQERLADPLTIRIAGGAREETKKTINRLYLGSGSSSAGKNDLSWDRRQRYVLYVTYEVEPPPPFTMGNPVELAWELIPFSWLIDGLVDVGSVLSSLDALRGVKSIKGTLTTRDRQVSICRGVPTSSYYPVKPGIVARISYKRDVLTTIPLGTIQWNPSRSWRKVMHAVSALTVLNQRCRGEYATRIRIR